MKLSVAQIKRVTRDTIYISIHVTFDITPSKATCRALNFKFHFFVSNVCLQKAFTLEIHREKMFSSVLVELLG